jgi:EAL and modified HD-GYP domain-containing signal transduction protein
MEKEIIVARQPILNKDNELFAYELLYRDVENDNIISDNRAATASVLVHTLNQFGLKQILGSYPAFIKINGSFLMQDMIYSIPKEQFVLTLFDDIVPSGAILERIAHFHREGYRFAINDTLLANDAISRLGGLLKYLSYYKIDTRETDFTALNARSIIEHLNSQNIECIATKVESHKVYHDCLEAGFNYFQGYYFSRPKLMMSKIFNADQASVMNVWRLVVADSSIRDIAAAFEANPVLSGQLLSYVNSAAFHFKAPIRSIEQVLTLLGRMPLMQWLLLTINARKMASPQEQLPVQSLLLNRIETMLGLYDFIREKGNITRNDVHFVGLLSFIDILLGVPLSTVLKELNVHPEIREALLEQKGLLGDLLKAARAIEYFNMEALESFLAAYDIPVDDVVSLTFKTIEKVNTFETSL